VSNNNTQTLTYGLHAVQSLIKNHPQRISKLWVLKGRHDHRLQKLLDQAKGIDRVYCKKEKLFELTEGENHQGIVAECGQQTSAGKTWTEDKLYQVLEDLEQEERQNQPLLLILDGVTDPHNLGACLRTADAAGVLAVIIPKDKSVGHTPVVSKVACGAAETVPLVQVTNLSRTLKNLQKMGIWIIGTSGEAEKSLFESQLTGSMALVMGAEGKGMRRLTQENCDELLFLPMAGQVSSLNVSVATGVGLFEIVRQRKKIK